jgi:glucuronosyltransferase
MSVSQKRHPYTKLLIAHGGMPGTPDVAYHMVPLMGLPFDNDQMGNVDKVRRGRWNYILMGLKSMTIV